MVAKTKVRGIVADRWTRGWWLPLAGVMMCGAAPAGAETHNPTRTFAANEYVPLYPGENDVRLRGSGIEHALGVQLPPGVAESAEVRAKTVGRDGVGEILVTIRVKRGMRGKVNLRVVHQAGRVETFKARIFRRGVVHGITAPKQATVGAPVNVAFNGEDFGVASMRSGESYFASDRSGGTNTAARFSLTFRQCGTFHVMPQLLHDATAPASEVASGEARFTGTVMAVVHVGPAPGAACPAPIARGASTVPFCVAAERWEERSGRCVAR